MRFGFAGVLGLAAGLGLAVVALGGCAGAGMGISNPPVTGTPIIAPALQRILFVGDSYTYGRYAPVRQYGAGGTSGATKGSALVFDENYGQTGARAEMSSETGPWGGVPGIFAQLAVEAGLNYDVHLEAIASTSLGVNYTSASSVIAQSQWNAVVLQEISTRPISKTFTGSSTSNPSNFCQSVNTIEAAVHTADSTAGVAAANIYLYETWPRGDMAQTLAGSTTTSGFAASYAADLTAINQAYHNVYYRAAAADGKVAGVAPVGDAWVRAWSEGIANPNPYTGASSLPVLWYGLNATNDPVISSADYAHPSIYGAYLAGLVTFQQVTGVDVRTLGGSEKAAAALGISSSLAVQLQQVAWEAVTQASSAPINQTVDPCTLTS